MRSPLLRRVETRRAVMTVRLGVLLATIIIASARAGGPYLPVFGGPAYRTQDFFSDPPVTVNNSGTAVGTVFLESQVFVGDYLLGIRGARWDGSGAPPVDLDAPLNVDGYPSSAVRAINDAGVAVGESLVFSADGLVPLGTRPMRWNASGSAFTELGHLGTDANGVTTVQVSAINSAGTAVGYANKYDASQSLLDRRAVRWDPSGTAAVELANPFAGEQSSIAFDINDAGMIIGVGNRLGDFNDGGPIRWDASGTPVVLDSLRDPTGGPSSTAFALNSAGAAVGNGLKYGSGPVAYRAIRWEADGTAYTELKALGSNANGYSHSSAWYGINDAGDVVGESAKYDESGNYLGTRAVRWDGGTDEPTELDHLGDSHGFAYAINAAGVAVGGIRAASSRFPGGRAAYWRQDGSAVDLNTLIDPASGWVLRYAANISDTGWITGHARFDPDGPGGQDPYWRLFLINVPETAIPEPGSPGMLLAVAAVLAARRRRRRGARCALSRVPAVLTVLLAPALPCPAQTEGSYLPVFGGPTYPVQEFVAYPPVTVNNAGTAAGTVFVDVQLALGTRAVRWDGSGAPPVEFDTPINADGYGSSVARAINDAGVTVGESVVFAADNVTSLGTRATRWPGPGATAVQLGHLGTNAQGHTLSEASSINASSTAVGYAVKYDAAHQLIGQRAVRWDVGSTVPVELATPSGFGADNPTGAVDINDAGIVVGWVQRLEGIGEHRPVRWDAAGNPAVLDSIGVDPSGSPQGSVFAVNNAGTALGRGDKYAADGTFLGPRAIRWDAGGPAATELQGLGSLPNGYAWSAPGGMNDAGDIVGHADKFDESGTYLGERPVRWDPANIAPTELDSLGESWGRALAINSAAVAVGFVSLDFLSDERAVYWRRDGTGVDLNTLIDPDNGWFLRLAADISDTGWITGYGRFDPDGPGGQDPYWRLFLMHVPEAAVPEPVSLVPLCAALIALPRRRRG